MQTNGNDLRNSNIVLIFYEKYFLKNYQQKNKNRPGIFGKSFFEKQTIDTRKRVQSTDLIGTTYHILEKIRKK